jgi:catechol 2,3-dioxygenase-like lactoylglutathione lyase family enzyme
MRITRLVLNTPDLAAQRDFYEGRLGFECTAETETEVAFRVGWTSLVFRLTAKPSASPYHFAFNIPENQFQEAKKWFSSRLPLIANHEGQEEFFFES